MMKTIDFYKKNWSSIGAVIRRAHTFQLQQEHGDIKTELTSST